MERVFLSANENKLTEVKEMLETEKIHVLAHAMRIDEIQSESMEKIVKDKVKKAYAKLKRPLLVEQTGLLISDFGNLPGGLTQVFWDALQADKFCQYFYGKGEVLAETVLAYCDGKRIYLFSGSVKGIIVPEPRGDRTFQWDCVFQPEGQDQTFAEMPKEKKNEISMRRIALDQFHHFWEQRYV
jgi:XTP/dITP diphosphohydrolase